MKCIPLALWLSATVVSAGFYPTRKTIDLVLCNFEKPVFPKSLILPRITIRAWKCFSPELLSFAKIMELPFSLCYNAFHETSWKPK
jgi:hypothetical protein